MEKLPPLDYFTLDTAAEYTGIKTEDILHLGHQRKINICIYLPRVAIPGSFWIGNNEQSFEDLIDIEAAYPRIYKGGLSEIDVVEIGEHGKKVKVTVRLSGLWQIGDFTSYYDVSQKDSDDEKEKSWMIMPLSDFDAPELLSFHCGRIYVPYREMPFENLRITREEVLNFIKNTEQQALVANMSLKPEERNAGKIKADENLQRAFGAVMTVLEKHKNRLPSTLTQDWLVKQIVEMEDSSAMFKKIPGVSKTQLNTLFSETKKLVEPYLKQKVNP